MSKFCPICDSQVTSSFCKSCKKFITPYEIKEDIHLNEGHGKEDLNCDYHGTTPQTEYMYHQTTADPCLYDEPPKSDSIVSKRAVMICTAIIAMIVAAVVFIVIKEVKSSVDERPLTTQEVVVNPFGQQIAMDADKLAKLRAENGYDEEGIKKFEEAEAKKMNVETNYYNLMDETHVITSRHIVNELDKTKLYYDDLGEIGYSNNYFYMDAYGEEWILFESLDSIEIFADSDQYESLGYIDIWFDTCSGKTFAIDVVLSDKDKCRTAVNSVMNALGGIPVADSLKLNQKFVLTVNQELNEQTTFELGDYIAYYTEYEGEEDKTNYMVSFYLQ